LLLADALRYTFQKEKAPVLTDESKENPAYSPAVLLTQRGGSKKIGQTHLTRIISIKNQNQLCLQAFQIALFPVVFSGGLSSIILCLSLVLSQS